jgi:hypothetical protein
LASASPKSRVGYSTYMKLWAISSFDARKIGQGTRLKIKINYYVVLFLQSRSRLLSRSVP